MEIYMAFLRAINVGGTGKIAKDELLKICLECGFSNAKTYIQSGNLIFSSNHQAHEIKQKLETALTQKLGKHHQSYIRNIVDMDMILRDNPFKEAAPNRVLVYFHDFEIKDITNGIKHQKTEEIISKGRETYVHYGDGMGSSKLIIPSLKQATGRNINTIEKVLEIAKGML